LKFIKRTFIDIYNELEKECGYVIVTRCGDDIMINNFLIKRTTEFGKWVFIMWWKGYNQNAHIFDSFKFDSLLLEPLY
jgi:hypothetical protein